MNVPPSPAPVYSKAFLRRIEQCRTPDCTQDEQHCPSAEGECEKMAWEGGSAVEHANSRMQRIEFERRKAKLVAQGHGPSPLRANDYLAAPQPQTGSASLGGDREIKIKAPSPDEGSRSK